MNNILNTISSAILSKDLSSCSTEELEQLCHNYPFAGALQLLYAAKLKEAGDEAYPLQWQKALLYFNNPMLLQHVVTMRDAPINREDEGPVTIGEKDPLQEQINNEEVTIPEDDVEEAAADISKDENQPEIINIPGLKIEPIDPEKAALSFTPYHTIDYFASQGIKIGDDIRSADRFGNQLKTFTSWLKEMRRLPETEAVRKLSVFEQSRVEKLAESSLSGENAVTQAMAEVWVKQGNLQKAIGIYKKLSLQNPAKSAFFAAKIEYLKKQL